MKLVKITCQSCHMSFQVNARAAGKRGGCPNPHCRQEFVVPYPTTPQTDATENNTPHPPNQTTTRPAPRHTATDKPNKATKPTKATAPVRQTDTPQPPLKPPATTHRSQHEPTPAARTKPNTRQATTNRARRRSAHSRPSRTWTISGTLAALALIAALGLWLNQAPSTDQAAQADNGSAKQDDSQLLALAENPATDEEFHNTVVPFFQTYCLACHEGPQAEGGLQLELIQKPDDVLARRTQFEKLLGLLDIKAMPPVDSDPLPNDEQRAAVVAWLEAKLFYVNCQINHDAGRVTVRRLNRNEYNNTIRDLLGVHIDAAADFPSDDVGNGFDNMGDVLSLPPLLLEKYLDAAETIANATIVTAQTNGVQLTRSGHNMQFSGSAQADSNGTVHMNSSGAATARFQIPAGGEYTVSIDAAADQAGKDLARMRIEIDGRSVKTIEVKEHRKFNSYELTAQLDQGEHRISAAFINDYYNPKAKNPRDRDRNLSLRRIQVTGPHELQLTEPHRRLVIATPEPGTSPTAAARQVFARFLPRAYRRPVTEDEIDRIMRVVNYALSENESYERALQIGLQAVLVSPHFLFRVELDDRPDDPSAERALNDYELASRLSYFLWSSMPDAELFDLAATGQLSQPDMLEQQVRRMLQDPNSQALIEHFIGQWLNLRNLEITSPDPKQFDSFDDALRDDMVTETLKFAAAIKNEDRSILDFLDADFTYINQRLARHYGLPDIKGNKFQRVELPGDQRAGVLTHASILTLTSNPTRTSPVKRGKWIMENILGTPPPPAPPGVPDLEETVRSNPDASLREQLRIHRADPGCASCHTTMDAIGFGFENFDAIGRWRVKDGQHPIDSSGSLPTGESFAGPVELVQILKTRDEKFAATLAGKMLTYATGRGLEYFDRCSVDEIVQELKSNDYRFSVLVTQIVQSKPFRFRRGDAGALP